MSAKRSTVCCAPPIGFSNLWSTIRRPTKSPASLASRPIRCGVRWRHRAKPSRSKRRLAPLESAAQHILREQIDIVLQKLPERERRIIQLRYGLQDGHYRTLEEVGREFGITRERIRQIEARVLRKLRHPHYGRGLRGYLE